MTKWGTVWSVAWFFTAPGGDVFGAEIALVPVHASGVHRVSGNEIMLKGGGQRVTLEIRVSGWAPEELQGCFAVLDSSGYSSGLQGTLTPEVIDCHGLCSGGANDGAICNADADCSTCHLGVYDGLACRYPRDCPNGTCERGDCDTTSIDEGDRTCRAVFGAACGGATIAPGAPCVDDDDCPDVAPPTLVGLCRGPKCAFPRPLKDACEPGFILASRRDYVFLLVPNVFGVNRETLDYRYGSGSLVGPLPDQGSVYYTGTLVLDVPVEARGTFTIDFLDDLVGKPRSFLHAGGIGSTIPLDLIPARITVHNQSCSLPSDCDDGDFCTTDICVCDEPSCKVGGLCSNENHFNEQTTCCNPSTGAFCPKPTGLPADFNDSGTADLLDVALFSACFGRVPLAGACESVDMDCDCDAELDDWTAVAPSLTGPNGQ